MYKRSLTGSGAGHFVTFNIAGRRNLLASPRARQIVISHLSSLVNDGRTRVTGFVVMPDHVHAILWLDDDRELPEIMKAWKALSSRSLQDFYRKNYPDIIESLKVKKSGREYIAFWQRRYHDFNLYSSKKIIEKLSYMHYNPVKNGLCSEVTDWIWGSARWYFQGKSVGVKIEPGFIDFPTGY